MSVTKHLVRSLFLIASISFLASAQTLPSLNSLSVSSGVQGSSVTVTLTGSGFAPGSTSVLVSGTGVVVSGVRVDSATKLTTLLLLSGFPGPREIRVRNDSGTSAALPFNITSSPIIDASQFETSTVFGTTGGIGAADGEGSTARFYLPTGLAGDDNYLYVADSGNATVRKVDRKTAAVSTLAGTAHAIGTIDGVGRAARFLFPFGMWVGDGYLYVSDYAARTIRRIDLKTAAVTTYSGSFTATGPPHDGLLADATFGGPGYMWGDGTNLYVTDTSFDYRKIRKIKIASGEVSTFADLGEVGVDVTKAVGIWGDKTYLWVADAARHVIRRINFATGQSDQVAGNFNIPYYLERSSTAFNGTSYFNTPSAIWGVLSPTANGSSTIFVADSGNNAIRFVSTGSTRRIAGSPPVAGYADGFPGVGSFNFPAGLWGADQFLYVSDSYNHVIRQVPIASIFTDAKTSTVAGVAGAWGSSDGAGTSAKLFAPYSIWGDGSNLYVSDTGNFTVRKISLDTKAVTTLAGKVGTPGLVNGSGASAGFDLSLGIGGDLNGLYVAELADTVRKVRVSDGNVTPFVGDPSNASGYKDDTAINSRFHRPSGVWSDGTYVYVADTWNYCVRKVEIATAIVTTVAGLGTVQGTTDGIGSSARFLAPTDVWGDGRFLYVADFVAIRRIDLNTREVLTFSGSLNNYGYVDGDAKSARFGTIYGIWGDGTYVYVADGFNHSVRRVYLDDGSVDTMVGSDFGTENGRDLASKFLTPSDVWGDGTYLYVSDLNGDNIRRIAAVQPPVTPPNTTTDSSFTLARGGATTQSTSGEQPTATIGYGRIQTSAGSAAPSALAIFDYSTNGVLVSETAVPASETIRSGRIYTEINGPIETGIAIANPNDQPVTITFYFTNVYGNDVNGGSLVIPANGQIAAFLDETPFSTSRADVANLRTFTFNASLGVAVIALRQHTNERGEALLSTLPVSPVQNAASESPFGGINTQRPAGAPISANPPTVFPHFADGSGWTTQLILVNSSDSPQTGRIQFFSQGKETQNGESVSVTANGTTASSFSYTISPRGSFNLITSGDRTFTQVGSIYVVPDGFQQSPSGVAVFSLKRDGITVAEAGVPGLTAAAAFRLYVEAQGNFRSAAPGAIESGFAIANSSSSPVLVSFELTNLDGTPTGMTASATVPGKGQLAMFLNEIAGFENLPSTFRGVLRVSGSGIAVIGLRGRYNERQDFLITTTPPTNELSPPTASEFIFPHLVDGGGYKTQVILYHGVLGEAPRGVIRFYDPKGQVVDLKLH